MNIEAFIAPAAGGGLAWLLSGSWELGVSLFAGLLIADILRKPPRRKK